MPIAAHARPSRRSAKPIIDDPAWCDVAREVRAAMVLIHPYGACGLSRSSAGWAAEDNLRRGLAHLEQALSRYVASARTRLGRFWRRRKTRIYVEQFENALWFTGRMQGWEELICPPMLFYRDGTLPLLDRAIELLNNEASPVGVGVDGRRNVGSPVNWPRGAP